jgi:DnaJ-class molecular chaperone
MTNVCSTCDGDGWVAEQWGGGWTEKKTCPTCGGSGEA